MNKCNPITQSSDLKNHNMLHWRACVSGNKTGRLIKYDPKSKETTVLENLTFPNGVALSKDGYFILVADTTNCKILRLWLKSSKSGIVEDFAHLSGFPDNIRRNLKGESWVQFMQREGRF
ncbi:hypothetical protein ACSBR2_020196 [Camellia fascicularis]